MRAYPRAVHKGTERRLVLNEQEEYEAGLEGFERHRNPEVNAREKGTDKEILRVNPEMERKRLEREKAMQFSADLIEVAKKAILEDRERGFQPHNGDNMLNRESVKITDVIPEINKKQRGTDENLSTFYKEMIEETEDPPYVKFEAITGFKAICDRGPYKGQETKGFKEWMKNGSDR